MVVSALTSVLDVSFSDEVEPHVFTVFVALLTQPVVSVLDYWSHIFLSEECALNILGCSHIREVNSLFPLHIRSVQVGLLSESMKRLSSFGALLKHLINFLLIGPLDNFLRLGSGECFQFEATR